MTRVLSEVALKYCTGCETEKSVDDFSRRGRNDSRPRPRCKACCLAYQHTRPKPKLDPVLRAARTKRWLDKNPGWMQEYRKRYYEDHREEIAAKNRVNRAPNGKHYSIVLAYVNRRRARLAEAEGSHTVEEWEALCAEYGYRCAACGKDGPMTRDHVQPLSKGGSDYISNIQPLCHSCNCKKLASTTDYRT